MHDLNLHHLKLFHAVAAAQSFSRAAEILSISQPAISKQLQQLETQLGLVLIERSSRRFRLTTAGERLQTYASRLDELTRTARAEMNRLAGQPQNSLRIGGTPLLSTYLLPKGIVEFSRCNANIRSTLETANVALLLKKVRDGTLDVVFTETTRRQKGICIETVANLDMVVIAPRSHILAKHRSVTLAQISKEPFVLRDVGKRARGFVETRLRARSLIPSVAMKANSTEAMKRAVAAGLGIAVVHQIAVELEISAGLLQVISVRDFKLSRPLKMITRKGCTIPLIAQFANYVRQFAVMT